MPAINPNNYNIDFFQSYSFGDITDNSYLSYLFQQNLPDISPELISSPAGSFQDIYNTEKGLEKDINYTSISNPGSIDEWVQGSNFDVSLFDVAYQNPSQNIGTNQYGPNSLEAFNYENPDLIVEDTGYLQYPTSTGGGAGLNLLTEGLDAVGLGGLNNLLIDFDSPLNDIAKKRRIEELKSRIKENLVNETVGRINLDPLGLLAGQPLFGKDYKITKPAKGIPIPGLGILTDLADVNLLALRGKPLPDGAFDWDSPSDDPFSPSTVDISETLLKRTGAGTKGLLFKSLKQNIYGPRIEGQNDSLTTPPKAEDTDQPSQKTGYLSFGNAKKEEKEKKKQLKQEKKLGKKAKRTARRRNANLAATEGLLKLNSLADKVGEGRNSRPDIPLSPIEPEDPSILSSYDERLKFQGFEFVDGESDKDFTYQDLLDTWNRGHNDTWQTQKATIAPLRTLGYETIPGSSGGNDGAEPGAQVFKGGLYWQEGMEDEDVLPRRGLLNYTQKLINKSTNVNGAAGRFIGLPNSDVNYATTGGDRRHTLMSQGNLVKDTKPNVDGIQPYCRSWSVRNAYNTYDDLIRSSELWRDSQPGLKKVGGRDVGNKLGDYTTLQEHGMPKIAWEKDGIIEKKINLLRSGEVPKNLVIPYMFSIENLAWKDSPHYYKLPNCEKGPHGGRIMWFPPYNINFTDNTSVNWDTTKFIGRAEPIYTYNDTERTGTLSFSVIVDHPSIINKLKEDSLSGTKINEKGEEVKITSSQNLETFFAGCDSETIKEILRKVPEIEKPDEIPEPETVPVKEVAEIQIPEVTDYLTYHFKNSISAKKTERGSTENGYYAVGGYQRQLVENSGCNLSGDNSIIGRCFDYNYEDKIISWYDNPRLYKGGADNYGSNGECPPGKIVNNDFNEDSLEVIPLGFTTTRPLPPPCDGKESSKQPWGPNPEQSKNLVEGNAAGNQKLLWSKGGKGYEDFNYCCPIGATGTTIGGTGFTDFSKIGFYEERPGFNQRFWGTNVGYEQSTNGTSPILELPAKDYQYRFEVDGPISPIVGGPGTGISQLIEFLTCTPEGKQYTIKLEGNCSAYGDEGYNQTLGEDRAKIIYKWMKDQMKMCEEFNGGAPKLNYGGAATDIDLYSENEVKETSTGTPKRTSKGCTRWDLKSKGKGEAGESGMVGDDVLVASGDFTVTPGAYHPADYENEGAINFRYVKISLVPAPECIKPYYDELQKIEENTAKQINEDAALEVEREKQKQQAQFEKEKEQAKNSVLNMYKECDYFETIKKEDSFLYDSIKDKLKNFHPAFHSITPEGFNSRITFLQQCGRQGPSFVDPNQPQNTAFGRPPVCILRLGDFYFSKIIIDSINFNFDPLQWDLNPEGIGVQPQIVSVDLNFKFIGGSTLQGPLTQLQNAVSYNFFANTAIYMPLEKILTKRGDKGQLLVDGVSDADEFNSGTDDRTYYYGPWASQQAFEEEFNGVDGESETNELEEEVTELEVGKVEQGSPAPCPDGKGRILTNEEVIQNSPPESSGIDPNDPDGTYFISTELLNQYPLTDYYWYQCDNGAPEPFPREDSNPLNKTEGENEDAEDSEVTTENTTDDKGEPMWRDINSLKYGEEFYENEFGSIILYGNYMDLESGLESKGSFATSISDPTNGLLPMWVYGGLLSDKTSDWDIQITQISEFRELGGGSSGTGGGSNNGVIWDNNGGFNQIDNIDTSTNKGRKYNTCCDVDDSNYPTSQVGNKLFAFNVLERLTGYESFEEWQFNIDNGTDSVLEGIDDEISNYAVESDDKGFQFDLSYGFVKYFIQIGENKIVTNEDIKNGKGRKYSSGSVIVEVYINKKGLEALKLGLLGTVDSGTNGA